MSNPVATTPRSVAFLAMALLSLGSAAPQGGPPDTVPPDTVPPPSSTPRTPLPATPGRAQPSPRLRIDTGAGAGLPGGVTTATSDDLAFSQSELDGSRWERWWALNRDGYLQLKGHVWRDGAPDQLEEILIGHGGGADWVPERRPSEETRASARAALEAQLRHRTDPAFLAEGLVALARLGPAPNEHAVFLEYTGHASRDVAERALLALGLGGGAQAVPVLASLVRGGEAGCALLGRESVPRRTRALAAWSLGLAGRGAVVDVVHFARRVLLDELERDDAASPDLAVACLGALAELGPPARGDAAAGPTASREAWVATLLAVWEAPETRSQVRAHVPRTVVRAIETAEDEALRARIASSMLRVLGTRSDAARELRAGAAAALGTLGDADADPVDRAIVEALFTLAGDADLGVRHFALMALAEVAGRSGPGAEPGRQVTSIESFLRRQLLRGKGRTRPWAALALGAYAHAATGAGRALESESLSAMQRALEGCRTPQDIGAYALGLGLARDHASAERLVDALERFDGDAARAHLCVALGLIGLPSLRQSLHAVVAESENRPALLESAAIASTLLGDDRLIPALLDALSSSPSGSVRAALLGALENAGDQRALAPLIAHIAGDEATTLERAAAARALGAVGSLDALPWSASVARGQNYLALVETLMSADGTGLLNRR